MVYNKFYGSSFPAVYGMLIATFLDLLCCITCLMEVVSHCLWYVGSHLFGFSHAMFYGSSVPTVYDMLIVTLVGFIML